ncbi:hypothetical protein JCM3775_004715, partial [Rhodotorula graminis]
FVRWASEQVEIYAEMFRRQVYGVDQDGRVIDESLEVTKAHGAMLRDVGLDFTFLLDGLLRPHKPVPQPRVSSSRLRDDALTGSHLRPAKATTTTASSGGQSGGEPQSAVALARQSIFLSQSQQGSGAGRQGRIEVPSVPPQGRGSGEESRGAVVGAAGPGGERVGAAQ